MGGFLTPSRAGTPGVAGAAQESAAGACLASPAMSDHFPGLRRRAGAVSVFIAAAAALVLSLPGGAADAQARPGDGNDGGAVDYSCAADRWPWGCVARCESGGNWRANTGN